MSFVVIKVIEFRWVFGLKKTSVVLTSPEEKLIPTKTTSKNFGVGPANVHKVPYGINGDFCSTKGRHCSFSHFSRSKLEEKFSFSELFKTLVIIKGLYMCGQC